MNINNSPKILFLDIETSPILGYVWGMFEENVIAIKEDWHILSMAYKWGHENIVHVKALNDYPRYSRNKKDDMQLMLDIRSLLDEADIVVAHNGDAFDMRKINARLIINGLTPPSPYTTIDTKKIAKSRFKFNSNSLKNLALDLQVGEKMETGGFNLWLGVLAGDEESWNKMKAYNKQDVVVLEKIYNVLAPYLHTHPSRASNHEHSCPRCSSTQVQSRGHIRMRTGSIYQRFYCSACGSWSRGRIAEQKTSLTPV